MDGLKKWGCENDKYCTSSCLVCFVWVRVSMEVGAKTGV